MIFPAWGVVPHPGRTSTFWGHFRCPICCPCPWGSAAPPTPRAGAPGAGGEWLLLGVLTAWWLRSLGTEPSSCAPQMHWGIILPSFSSLISSLSVQEWINRSAWPPSVAGRTGVPLARRVLGKHREGKWGVLAPTAGLGALGRAELWGCCPQRGCGGVPSLCRASHHLPAWGPPTSSSPPRPSEMPLVLAPCPLPSSHQLVTASSLGWPGSSRPTASSCIQHPVLPSFPRLGEPQLLRQPRLPGSGPAHSPSPCRAVLLATDLLAVPSPCWGGWIGRTEQSGSLRSRFALRNNRAWPRLTCCRGWDPAGKGWAGSGAVLPAGCGPGLSVEQLSGS